MESDTGICAFEGCAEAATISRTVSISTDSLLGPYEVAGPDLPTHLKTLVLLCSVHASQVDGDLRGLSLRTTKEGE